MKATEEFFPMGLFIMFYKGVVTFEAAGETKSVTFKWKWLRCTAFSITDKFLKQHFNVPS